MRGRLVRGGEGRVWEISLSSEGGRLRVTLENEIINWVAIISRFGSGRI